jgi:hypothetical protein
MFDSNRMAQGFLGSDVIQILYFLSTSLWCFKRGVFLEQDKGCQGTNVCRHVNSCENSKEFLRKDCRNFGGLNPAHFYVEI